MVEELLNNPLFGLLLTIGVYWGTTELQKKFPYPFMNPLLLSVVIIILFLSATGIPYESYNEGASVLSLFVTPATVAMAIPLQKNIGYLRRYRKPILGGIFAGVLLHGFLVVALALLFQLNPELTATLIPKSVTTPIAVGIADSLGGYGSITIAIVILTGILGSVFAPALFKWLGITHPIAEGISLGTAAHAVGTSTAVQMGELQGAMASLALVITGLMTVVAAPLLYQAAAPLFH